MAQQAAGCQPGQRESGLQNSRGGRSTNSHRLFLDLHMNTYKNPEHFDFFKEFRQKEERHILEKKVLSD